MVLEWKLISSNTVFILLTKTPEAENVNGEAVAFRRVKICSMLLMGIAPAVCPEPPLDF